MKPSMINDLNAIVRRRKTSLHFRSWQSRVWTFSQNFSTRPDVISTGTICSERFGQPILMCSCRPRNRLPLQQCRNKFPCHIVSRPFRIAFESSIKRNWILINVHLCGGVDPLPPPSPSPPSKNSVHVFIICAIGHTEWPLTFQPLSSCHNESLLLLWSNGAVPNLARPYIPDPWTISFHTSQLGHKSKKTIPN